MVSKTRSAKSQPHRCHWAKTELSIAYHDREWGIPVHDDRTLFEFLILEGAQAGLSWETILRKRENYRVAFDNFDPRKVARYNQRKVARLLGNAGIIRNRLKINSAIQNAKACLAIQKEFGSFDAYVWRFVGGKPIKRKRGAGVQAFTPQSDSLSRDLAQRGLKFVGSTICYSFMQAVGMVNDHEPACFRIQGGILENGALARPSGRAQRKRSPCLRAG
jgi:DNA-3-methyladenine glycosylase I